MEFKQPDLFVEPESKSMENQDTHLIQHDEDTMASLDLFIETLETDAQEGRNLVPPSPLHSDSNFDIYSGLDDNAVSASEHLSKSCRADYRNQFLNPPGAQGSPQYSQRSQECHFASPNKDLECSNKEQEQCVGEQNFAGLSPKGPDKEQVQNLQMAVNLGQGKAPTSEDFQSLMNKYTTLRANMLSLCYTAQREMQRKMALINELREEIESHRSDAGVRKSQSEVGSQSSLVSAKDQPAVKIVVHSHVQTEPSVLSLCKDDSVKPVTVGTASISIQTVTVTMNATSAQTEAVKFSERLVQTDSTSVSSSSSQTAPCPLKSAGVQTGPDLPVSVKEVASQSCPVWGGSKSVQTEHAENSHEKNGIDLVSQVTEQEVTLKCSALMDSKSVQAVFSNGNQKHDGKEHAVVLKSTEEVSAQRSLLVMVSDCSLANSKEIQQGWGGSEQQSHTTACDPDTSVKCVLETDAAASVGVPAEVPDSGFAQAGSLLRSQSTDVSSSAVEQINSGEKKRRHSSSPMSGSHGDCKRGRYSPATGQLSRIQSADSSKSFHTSTPMHEYTNSKNLEKPSSKELSVSFQTACSITPCDNFSADFVLSDDDEEEGEEESVGKSNRDVSTSEQFVTASMHSGDSRSSDVNDLQLVSETDINPGMDEIEKESASCHDRHDSNEYASLPPVIESPSDDNVFVESFMFKKPIPSQVVGGNSSKASLTQLGSGDASPSLQSEQSHPVLGPFKHVQGQEWRRKLFLWATYAHRRVSRKQEIDTIYYGHQTPKVFDWRTPDQCQQNDAMCGQTVSRELPVSDVVPIDSTHQRKVDTESTLDEEEQSIECGGCSDKNDEVFVQDSEQMSCHSGHEFKQDIEQEVIGSDARVDLQNSDQKTVDRNENSDASSISGGPRCSVSFDSTLSDAKSTESKSSAHKKKAKRKKKKKDKKSTEKRMEKRAKKKQRKRDDGDSLTADGLADPHGQQYDQEGNSQKQSEQSQGTYPKTVPTGSEPWSAFPQAVTVCREAEVKQAVSATDTRTSDCGGMLSPHLNFEQPENCSLNVVQNQKSTLASVAEEQLEAGIEGLDSGGTLHSEEPAAAEETSSDRDIIDAPDSDEEGSEMLFDAGNKAAALNSPVNDAAGNDSDFSIHTDDSDTEDSYPQTVVLQTNRAQNISIPQAYGTRSSGSETTNASDGQCSESDDAMDISVGRDEQRSLPGCEAALQLSSADSAQVHVRSSDGEVPTMPSQPSLTPGVASDFSATVIKMPDILQEKTDGEQCVEITATAEKQPCMTDEALSEFPNHPAIPFSSVQPPATPEKLPFVNSKESVEVRTPDAKLVSSLCVSKGSPIWSPEKSSFTLLNSESMDAHLYNKLLGDTSNSLSNPSPSKESVTDCSASQAHKTAPSVTHITAVTQKGKEDSSQFKTLSCEEKHSSTVTEESKAGESGKSRKQDLVSEEGPTKLPVDDKTPLFGYPSFTTLLKGGTKLSFQYKRRPDYLAPSSSSSASSVTASSSSSATSTSSSSSLPTEPSNQRPSSTVQSTEKLEVLKECSVEDTDSKGFSVGSESNGTNTSTASAERKGGPIFVQENSDKECEQMSHAEGCNNAVRSPKAKNQRPAARNRSNLTESCVESNDDACSLPQEHGSGMSACARTKVGKMSADLKKSSQMSGSGNGSTTVISTAIANFKPAVEKELEEGEVDSSGSFVRLCDRGGDCLQAMPDMSEAFEESMEEGEIRTADGTAEDDEHIDSSASMKSPQPIDSENAQFRDIRDLLQAKQQHTKASYPAAANTASKCSLYQNSGFKSEENFADSRKGSAVSTTDKTSLPANIDLKAQKCRESRDQMERVRRQIFGQQASYGVSAEMHSNADGPAAKSYKIPKLDKNTRDIRRRRRVAEEHNRGRRKPACPPGRSTRAPKCKLRIPVSHSSDTQSWKYGTRTGPTSRSPKRTSASRSLQHDDHAAATFKSSKHAHSVSTSKSPEHGVQLCTSRSSHHSSAVSGITEVDHVTTSRESKTYNEQDSEKSASSERVDVRVCGQKSGFAEVEGTDGFMLESDSDSSSSGSLTDPDLNGSCRTRRFIYYRNPYKDRPELEMSLDEDEDSDEDGQNSDQEDDNPKNQKECDNVDQDGSEDEEDDQRQGNCNEDAQEDCESDKREDTHGQGGVRDEEDPTQHLPCHSQNDNTKVDTSSNMSGQEQASNKNYVPSAGPDGRDLGLTRKEPSKPRASAEVNAFKEHKIKAANRTETDVYRCNQVGQENNRNHTQSPVLKGRQDGRVGHSSHEYQSNKEKENNTVEKDSHLGKELCCKMDGESDFAEEENNSDAGSGDDRKVSELFSADGGGACLGDKGTGNLSDGEIPDSSDECDDDKKSHKSTQEESTGTSLCQTGDTHVSKDAFIDCLSLDAFCNSEGHFLLEQSDMSANEDEAVGPSKQNTKRESQSGSSSSSVKIGKASTNASMNDTSTASCTERSVSSQQCRGRDAYSNNRSQSSTVSLSQVDGKNTASRDRYLQSSKCSTKGSKSSSGSPSENDRHYQDKSRLAKQSRFPSGDCRQKCDLRSSSKENGRPMPGRCSSTEEHSGSQERCTHSQPGSFSCQGHPRRDNERDHRFHRGSFRKRKMTSKCPSSSFSCEHKQTSSRNRTPSPNSERDQAWHRRSWHDEHHSGPSLKCRPPDSRRYRGYGEHRQSGLRLPRHPLPRGHVRNCTRSRGPAAREECSCEDCLMAHSRSCHCQSCSDGRRSGSPARCNASCGGPLDTRCKRRRDDSHSRQRHGHF